jgi:flagellar assembly protein FliH
MQTRLATLDQLLESLPEQLASADKRIGEDLLDLAISLAQALIKNTLELDREAILPIVTEAIGMLPVVQQPAQLFLHPDDDETIKIHQGSELEKAGWRIISDANITRGGCKLETAHNLIDATVATRWQRLSEALKPTTVAAAADET